MSIIRSPYADWRSSGGATIGSPTKASMYGADRVAGYLENTGSFSFKCKQKGSKTERTDLIKRTRAWKWLMVLYALDARLWPVARSTSLACPPRHRIHHPQSQSQRRVTHLAQQLPKR